METGLLTFEFYQSSMSFIARRSTVVQGITEKSKKKIQSVTGIKKKQLQGLRMKAQVT